MYGYYDREDLLDEIFTLQEMLAVADKAIEEKDAQLKAARENFTKLCNINAELNRRIANLTHVNETLVKAYNSLTKIN